MDCKSRIREGSCLGPTVWDDSLDFRQELLNGNSIAIQKFTAAVDLEVCSEVGFKVFEKSSG